MATVLYDEWEMACCGSPFEIGYNIEWTVSKVNKKDMDCLDKDQKIKNLAPYFITDYHYESHIPYSPDFLILSGIISKITIIAYPIRKVKAILNY